MPGSGLPRCSEGAPCAQAPGRAPCTGRDRAVGHGATGPAAAAMVEAKRGASDGATPARAPGARCRGVTERATTRELAGLVGRYPPAADRLPEGSGRRCTARGLNAPREYPDPMPLRLAQHPPARPAPASTPHPLSRRTPQGTGDVPRHTVRADCPITAQPGASRRDVMQRRADVAGTDLGECLGGVEPAAVRRWPVGSASAGAKARTDRVLQGWVGPPSLGRITS